MLETVMTSPSIWTCRVTAPVIHGSPLEFTVNDNADEVSAPVSTVFDGAHSDVGESQTPVSQTTAGEQFKVAVHDGPPAARGMYVSLIPSMTWSITPIPAIVGW